MGVGAIDLVIYSHIHVKVLISVDSSFCEMEVVGFEWLCCDGYMVLCVRSCVKYRTNCGLLTVDYDIFFDFGKTVCAFNIRIQLSVVHMNAL